MTKRTLTAGLALSIALIMGGCGTDDDIYSDNNNNDEIVTATEFTQSLISANPWYAIEEDAEEVYCSGTFIFDGNGNLTASWSGGEDAGTTTIPYSLTEGKITMGNDGDTTSTLLSSENDKLMIQSQKIKETETIIMDEIWFVNKTDAEAYLTEHGKESCYP